MSVKSRADQVNIAAFGKGIDNGLEAKCSSFKWFPYNKGGDFRRWYGNNEYVINWEAGGRDLHNYKPRAVIRNEGFFFKTALTWTFVSSAYFGVRYSPPGALFDVGGSSCFPPHGYEYSVLGYLASHVTTKQLATVNATLNFQVGNISRVGLIDLDAIKEAGMAAKKAVGLSQRDWDSYETSWDFTILPLLNPNYRQSTLKATYQKLRAHWREMTLEMQRLEQENNRIFIEAYGLQDELDEKVDFNQITCSSHDLT